MELAKLVLTVAMMITLVTKTIGGGVETNPTLISSTTSPEAGPPVLPKPNVSKRVSRFLQQGVRNPRAADHCHKDEEVCYIQDGATSTCCNNKCVYLATDDHNCGACKKKCKFTQVCCRGECVEIAFDKRHCGGCNHRCKPGEYCIYGMCSYA
ncbi:Stigma-specific STIG1-like protein 1 [Hibiscus syriacus]|uniref:Stigma-specific STIG1-like protein 1 n=1 Tax=Hibiscus syriacus TaxID=106335 RepID=A0A6A2YLM3_HIBSY|nr:stigma-specific STIG1-like protein 2 [Hibiscus syriacus]KAE8680232.1 Stigma-specific STIG1-like protein 1 [Hibiscus syriacus]